MNLIQFCHLNERDLLVRYYNCKTAIYQVKNQLGADFSKGNFLSF